MRLLRVGARRAAACAELTASLDLAGGVTLGLMFALEVPKGGPYVFGTTNDVMGALRQVAILPVLAEASAPLPAGPARDVLLPVTLAATAVGSASSALLVARVLPFIPSSVLSVAAMEVQGLWLLVTSTKRLQDPGYPRPLGRLGRLIGAGSLAGGLLGAAGFLMPRDSSIRKATMVAAIIPSAAAWAAWPVWLHLAARHLRNPSR